MAARLWRKDDEENLKYPQPVSTTRVYDTPSYSGQLVSAAQNANGTYGQLLGGANGGAGIGSDVGSAGAAGTEGPDTRSAWEIYRDNYVDKYNDMYSRHGRRAMQDTLGEVSARTGGLASSYAGAVAQETYDNYMAELSDRYPELVNAAYSMYQLDQSMATPQFGSGNAVHATYGSSSSYRGSKDDDDEKKKPSKAGSGDKEVEEEPAKEYDMGLFGNYNYLLNHGMHSPTAAWAAAQAAAEGNQELAQLITDMTAGTAHNYNSPAFGSTGSTTPAKPANTKTPNNGSFSPTQMAAIQQAEAEGNYDLANLLRSIYGG